MSIAAAAREMCSVFQFPLSFWWSWRLLPTSFMPIPNSGNTFTLLAATNRRRGFRASMHPGTRCLFTCMQVSWRDWREFEVFPPLVVGNTGLVVVPSVLASPAAAFGGPSLLRVGFGRCVGAMFLCWLSVCLSNPLVL